MLIGPAVATADAISLSRSEIGPRVHDDVKLILIEHVAQWFIDTTNPGDQIFAMCVSAAV